MFRISVRSAVMLCAAVASVACTESSGNGEGTVQLQLTDAPFAFSEVSRVDIHVLRIDAKMDESSDADAAAATASSTNEDPRAGWVTLASPNQKFNLLELRNGTVVNVGSPVSLPTGSYRGFRMIIDTDRSSVTLNNGTVLTGTGNPRIHWPSAGSSGIKIKLAQPITVGESGGNASIIVIDFDLASSFVMRGNTIAQNGLNFRPIIRAVARDITGTISGTVRSTSATGAVVAGATVEVLRSGTALTDTVSANVVATASTDASGNFTAAFVPPGSYLLRAMHGDRRVLSSSLTLADGQVIAGQVLVLP